MNKVYVRALVTAVLVFIADRVTKALAYHYLQESDLVVTKQISFSLTYNTGIAWSLLSHPHFLHQLCLSIVTLYFLYQLLQYAQLRAHSYYSIIPETLILVGGLSNVLDRIFYQGVIDFIKISIGNYMYPIFNVADISITLGSILLIWSMLTDKQKELNNSL